MTTCDWCKRKKETNPEIICGREFDICYECREYRILGRTGPGREVPPPEHVCPLLLEDDIAEFYDNYDITYIPQSKYYS